jgi:DNA polymerase IV
VTQRSNAILPRRRLREISKCHTDLIEPLPLDEAHLDVTENKTGLPTATMVARTIREQIRRELNLTATERTTEAMSPALHN